jgi:hypothetical protein
VQLLNRLPGLYASGKPTGRTMQTAAEQIQMFRDRYSKPGLFLHEGVKVRVVAHVMWTCSKGKEHWVFKLSNKKIIKVTNG